jgi:hypothetical protein
MEINETTRLGSTFCPGVDTEHSEDSVHHQTRQRIELYLLDLQILVSARFPADIRLRLAVRE